MRYPQTAFERGHFDDNSFRVDQGVEGRVDVARGYYYEVIGLNQKSYDLRSVCDRDVIGHAKSANQRRLSTRYLV